MLDSVGLEVSVPSGDDDSAVGEFAVSELDDTSGVDESTVGEFAFPEQPTGRASIKIAIRIRIVCFIFFTCFQFVVLKA